MSNGMRKKTKVRRFAKVLGLVVFLVVALFLFANIKVGNTPLHWAAAKNMADTAEILLTSGANVNEKNNKGATPLQWTAANNAAETAQLLLTQGAEVNAKNSEGGTPLHSAAANNAIETAQLLLTQGAEICAKDTLGRTSLHWAAWNNAYKTAQLLLRQGADVNAESDDGLTPLYCDGARCCCDSRTVKPLRWPIQSAWRGPAKAYSLKPRLKCMYVDWSAATVIYIRKVAGRQSRPFSLM